MPQILCYIQPCGDITLVKYSNSSKRYNSIFNSIENEESKIGGRNNSGR